jgi:hypothetical protein
MGILTVVKTRATRRREDGIQAWAARAMLGGGRELGGSLEMGKETSRGLRELYRGDWRGSRAELRRERRWARCAVRRRRDGSKLLRFRRTVGAVDGVAAAEG